MIAMKSASLQVNHATKLFPGVKALDDVSLNLMPGEIHALLGENGAGKSTLIKIITGVYRPDEGEVRIADNIVEFGTPQDALKAGIGTVHQERNLIPRYSIAENIMLDRLPTKNWLIDRQEMRKQAEKWLKVLDLNISSDTQVRRLSVAQMQLVEIARALSLQSSILLLDEPTASITGNEIGILFKMLRRLRDEGAAILFVSHKLEEVFDLCDKVTILRDGQNACESVSIMELDKDKVVAHMIGRDEKVGEIGERNKNLGATLLELEKVSSSFGHSDVSFSVKAGEVVGLYGLVGAGRSELAKVIMGAARKTSGTVKINGENALIKSVQDALQKFGIGYVSEDRKQEGLILSFSVARNTGITIWHRLGKFLGLFTDGMEKSAITSFIDNLNVRTPSLEQNVGNLSGGNQQKVSVAKWLAAKTKIMIIDEPTVGIDIRTKGYLHRLVWDLAEQGVAVLLVSSELPEMILLADRVLVMKDMKVIGSLENNGVYEEMSGKIMNCIHQEQ